MISGGTIAQPALTSGNGGSSASSWILNGFGNDSWNPIDFLLPGTSLLNTLFDPTGANAAAAQFQSQLALQKDAQAYNSAEAQLSRYWDKMMSDTQYQRTVADLKAAGLNPWMLGNGVSPVSAQNAATAHSSQGSASMANNKMMTAAALIAGLITKGAGSKAAAGKMGAKKIVNNYFMK